MISLMIAKEQKRNGKRQTWALYAMRKGVSATVWERVPDVLPYYSAHYLMDVASQLYDLRGERWQRNQGRGSANYRRIAKEA